MLSFSNGTVINLGNIKSAKGDKGDKGDTGLKGADGINGANGVDGVGIQNVDVSVDGALTVTLTNGTVLNLGNIKGADGLGITKSEINASGELVLTYSNGDVKNLGKVTGENGANGANGADGRGIKSLTLSPDGELVVVMSDNSISNLGNIKGEKGDKGLQGEKGADGRGIAKTELVNGELIITYTDGTSDNLGSVSGAESGISDLLTYELLENDTYAVTGSIVSINKLTIPSSYNGKAVTEISEYAFKDEVSILSVTIPNTVVKICTGAFMYCTNLKTVRIPASVKEIERSAFTLNKSQFGDSKYSFSLYVEGENNWNGYASRQTSSTSFTPNSLVFTGELDGPQLAYSGTHRLDPNNNPYPYYSYGDVTYKRN